MVTETAAWHSQIPRLLDDISRNAMVNASAFPAPIFQPEYGSADDIAGQVSGESEPSPEIPGGNQPSPDEILWTLLSEASPEGIPVREIITATGMSRRWVYYRLQQSADAGLAVQVARGYWRAAP